MRSELVYKILLENSPDAVYCLSGTIFEYVNPMGAILFGYVHPSELIGKDAMSFVHPDYRQIVLERTIARQRGDSPPTRYEVKMLKKDGTAIDVEFHISIAVIEGKRITITYARNIEERVRYRSNLKALYRHINELAQADTIEAIIDTTLDAMSQALEFEFSSILQVVEDRLVMHTKNPEYQGLVLSLDGRGLTVQAVNTQSTILVEDTRKEPNYLIGCQTSLSELDVPVIINDKTVAVLNVEQNTVNAFNEDHKTLLETLSGHVSTAFFRLEKEKQLEEMAHSHIKDLIRNYQRISTMVRHDLRAPLQAVYNAAEILRVDPNQSEMRVLLKNQIHYIESILEDWKQQTINGKIERKMENIFQLVHVAVKAAITSDLVDVKIVADEGLMYNVDYNRMLRALSNIIKNSVDAMPEGGILTISAFEDGEKLVLRITDTGVGIPEENMDLIYDPFFTTKLKGMGLGLSFVRQVVEAHNGTMTMASKVGAGTTTTIYISI